MNIIYTFFIFILIITSFVLVLAILAQAGKGGGLAANFGGAGSSSDSFLGSRQASNLLTKASWTAGGIFLALSFILSQASSRPTGIPASILDKAQQQQQAPAPVGTDPSSSAPLDLKGLSVPANTDTGSGKAAEKALPPAGKAGDAKTPPKVPPPEY